MKATWISHAILMSIFFIAPSCAQRLTPLFELEKDGKIFYGIGTNHHLPLDVLPACVKETLQKGKALGYGDLEGLEMINDEAFCNTYDVFYKSEKNNNRSNPHFQLEEGTKGKIEELIGGKLREQVNKDWKDLSPWALKLALLFLKDTSATSKKRQKWMFKLLNSFPQKKCIN